MRPKYPLRADSQPQFVLSPPLSLCSALPPIKLLTQPFTQTLAHGAPPWQTMWGGEIKKNSKINQLFSSPWHLSKRTASSFFKETQIHQSRKKKSDHKFKKDRWETFVCVCVCVRCVVRDGSLFKRGGSGMEFCAATSWGTKSFIFASLCSMINGVAQKHSYLTTHDRGGLPFPLPH